VMREYEPAFEIDGFQFCVRRGRPIAPLLTAEIYQQRPAASGTPADPFDTLIKMHLLLPADQPIASIEIAGMDDPASRPLRLRGNEARIEVTPIDLAGVAHQQPQTRTFPFALRGPAIVALYFDRNGRGFSTTRTFIVVRNAAGAELALVRLRP